MININLRAYFSIPSRFFLAGLSRLKESRSVNEHDNSKCFHRHFHRHQTQCILGPSLCPSYYPSRASTTPLSFFYRPPHITSIFIFTIPVHHHP